MKQREFRFEQFNTNIERKAPHTFIRGKRSQAFRVIGPATTIVDCSFPVRNVHPLVFTIPTVGL